MTTASPAATSLPLGLVAAGSGGVLLATSDGSTWRPVPINIPHAGATNELRVDFVSPLEGFVCGRFGFVATTADGGQSWTDRSLPTFDESTTALHAVTASEAYMATSNTVTLQGRLLHTTDGARTWQTVWSGDDSILHIERSAADELWVCGTRGMILRREPAGAWVPLGLGCAGSAGVPTLTVAAPPRLGQTLGLRASSLPAAAPFAAALAGASSATWAGMPLPLDSARSA